MTALCGGGPSQIKPVGTAALQVLSPDALVELLAGAGWTWLTTTVYAVGYLTFDLSAICATDPPTLPTIDAPRLAGYVNPLNPQGAAELRQDATTIATYILWFLYCQCTTGTTPPIGPAAPQPTGIQINNNQGSGPVTGNCGSGGSAFATFTYDTFGNHTVVLGTPDPQIVSAQWIQVDMQLSGPGNSNTTPNDTTVSVQSLNASGAVIATDVFTQLAAQAFTRNTQTFLFHPGTAKWQYQLNTVPPATGTYGIQAFLRFYCTAAPPLATSACCPPDPLLEVLINQVLQLEQQILASLPGPKRPFVDSTVHAGLTGTGAVHISPTAAAIRVDVTARPQVGTPNPYQPPYLLSMGFITPFAVGTPLRGQRLVYDHQIYEYPSYTDQIGWGLEAGITISIVELVLG